MVAIIYYYKGLWVLFFKNLQIGYEKKKRIVHRVIFNAGDQFYCQDNNALIFNKSAKYFSSWLYLVALEHQFDTIICFGDCRPMHLTAKKWAEKNKVRFLAFEEGYLRPNFITLENGGVNAFSSMPKDPKFYRYFELPRVSDVKPIDGHFVPRAWAAMSYYAISWIKRRQFPHYRHHKIFSPWKEMNYWIRAGWRKQLYGFTEPPGVRIVVA